MPSIKTSRPSSLPSTVKIGAYTHTVVVSDEYIANSLPDYATDSAVGTSSLLKQVIYLGEDMGPDFAADTLLHEILHQCNAVGNGPVDDEGFVSSVSPVLLQVLRDNPLIVSYLLNPSAT